MVRKILGAIAGYLVFFICLYLLYSALYLAIGPDRAFLPGRYDPTIPWTASAFILGFIASVIGGYVAALIGRSGAVKIMAVILFLVGAFFAGMSAIKPKPDEVRTADVPNREAMMKARVPLWVSVVNPVLGVMGVFVGGGLRKNKEG